VENLQILNARCTPEAAVSPAAQYEWGKWVPCPQWQETPMVGFSET